MLYKGINNAINTFENLDINSLAINIEAVFLFTTASIAQVAHSIWLALAG